uniref:Neuritin 1 like n=1 Tax=Buteo japonicus TaxID=224669 RepID=A0A8C0APQ4_9AVES
MALVVIPNTLCHPSSCGWHWGLGVLRGLSSIFLSPAATSQEPVSMAGKCDTIYKGFAGCLLSLGDSMAQSVRRSWDDFHACATEVLSNCPEEAAAIWESLRQESRKIQFQGNLQELCSARGRVASAHGSPAMMCWSLTWLNLCLSVEDAVIPIAVAVMLQTSDFFS